MEQIITTALMLPYSYGLYYATVGLVFIRPRICAKFNLNSTIYWMIVYLLNMMLVRGLFKLNYLWLIFTSVILGGAIIQFANYNLIGITGGIGCGKSTFVNHLKTKIPGVDVIDSDLIVHTQQKKGHAVYDKIVQAFGTEILTPELEIDRKKLGSIIFNDSSKRRLLNSITHKPVFFEIWRQLMDIFTLKSGKKIAFLDAPLLFETKILEWFCYPIVTICVQDQKVWVQRLRGRDSISEEEALSKIKSQMSIAEKIKKSEIVLDNSKENQTEQLYIEFIKAYNSFVKF